MGDFWHANIVVSVHQQTVTLFLLDWELARTGLPGSEIGLFCGAMNFLVRGNQVASKPASVILQSFIEAYSRTATRDANLAQDTSSHWGLYNIFWAPRCPPGDKELVQDLVREGVIQMVQSRNQDFLARSHLKSLLPE
jgi:thiamine kinase-like enzyme